MASSRLVSTSGRGRSGALGLGGPWGSVLATRTRTVVFTDLSNYTASVARADRASLRDLLRWHEATVAPLLQRHDGRIVKTLGDSFMALFDSATDAVRAGLEIGEQSSVGGLPVRMSAATGDVEEIDGDVFGEAVNLASRINHVMPPSEIWFSEGTLQCMKQTEIPWEKVGYFALKGIAGEVPLYRGVPSSRAWLPEPIVAAARSHQLVLVDADGVVPLLPPDPLLLIRGLPPASARLEDLLNRLPVVGPDRIWLLAYTIAPADRHVWEQELGHRLVISTTPAFEQELKEVGRSVAASPSSDTIILESGLEPALEIAITGLALPVVPMADVVAGYGFDLLADGRWVNRADRPILRIDVSAQGAQLLASAPGVTLDERPVRDQDAVPLRDGCALHVNERKYVFKVLSKGPFVGILLSDAQTRLVVAGDQTAEIGREPNAPGIALPDRKGQQNIHWCAGPRAARARESGFTLDRALTGRRQTGVTVEGGQLIVEALHERCPTYVFRADGSLERVQGRCTAVFGDSIIVGTSVLSLGVPPR
jgi:class 3 adenylate cyclase